MRKRWMIWLAVLFLLAALCIDGQKRLVVSCYECPISDLPGSFGGFRILQLSDLHGAKFGRGNRRLLRAVEEARPDMIALTGDFIEKTEDLQVTGELLPELSEIAPCYFISGNHEWASGVLPVLERQLELAGVRYLRNEYVALERNGEEILLCGVEDPNSWADLLPPDALVAEAQRQHPEVPIVLLGHRNYWIREYPELPVELILCGHGHGGIVRIPGVGGLVGTDRLLFPAHTEGIHESGSYHMVVSRGLGSIYGLPRVFNNPEITAITLKKEA